MALHRTTDPGVCVRSLLCLASVDAVVEMVEYAGPRLKLASHSSLYWEPNSTVSYLSVQQSCDKTYHIQNSRNKVKKMKVANRKYSLNTRCEMMLGAIAKNMPIAVSSQANQPWDTIVVSG